MSKNISEIRVLHVDDEPGFAEMVAEYIERVDDRFTVATATSASEGLDRFASDEFDCLVSDYEMPNQNGIELLETIRVEHPDFPFILYTGKGSEEVASDAISAGVTDYLQKETGADQYKLLANRIRNAVERARAQRDSQRQLNAIETAKEGISILDEGGEFIYVNEAYADLYGYEPGEMIGEHWELIYRDEDASRVRDEILPEVVANGYWHGQTTGLRADDSTFIEDHSLAITDEGGLVCTVQDITERKAHEEELKLKTRAMDEAPVGILITDPGQDDNPIIDANDRFQQLTGYAEDEILGRNCRFLQGENTDPEPVAEMREAIDNREAVTVELRNYRKDGTEFWNRVSISPVEDADGDVTHFVGFQQDISEWKD